MPLLNGLIPIVGIVGSPFFARSSLYDFSSDIPGGAAANTTLIRGGTASVENATNLTSQILRLNGDATRIDISLDSIPQSDYQDVRLQMDVDQAANGRRHGILLFSNSDATSGYLIQWDDKTDQRIEIYRRNPGSPYSHSQLTETVGIPTTTNNKWRVKAIADVGTTTITVYSWDGSAWNVELQTTNTSYISGGVAVGQLSANLAAEYDNIDVTYRKSINLISPLSYQVFQRDSSDEADIVISGTYAGAPSAIEASWNGGAYATIDASPSGGTFSGTLSAQAAGQGQLIVRFADDPSLKATSNYVGVGDVFVVAGQSNAEGRGQNQQSYSHATLKSSVFRQDDAWKDGNDPTDTGVDVGSVWPLLASLHMADHSVPVGFITTATGNTKLYGDTWTKNGTEYADCVQTIQNSGVNGVMGILWHQGESDANDGVTAGQYETALSTMLNDLQADTGFAGMKLICANLGYKTTGSVTRANLDAIRLGQLAAVANDADILAGPILYDVGPHSDGVHFVTDAELLKLSQRWWRMLDYHFYSGSDGTAPVFSSAVRVGATVTVTFAGGVSPLTGATDTTGWRFTDDGAPITISSAAANGSMAVDLTLDSEPDGTGEELISFGSFNDGVGTTLLDSGTYPMPPHPFVDQPVANQWWIVAGQTVVAAYEPKGAASLAASYVNLANPGTYDAAPGVEPTLDASGWVFNGSGQYLNTSVVPATGYTIIIRYSDVIVGTPVRIIIGSYDSSGVQRFYIIPNRTSNGVLYAAGSTLAVQPGVTAGVLAIAGQNGYRDGVSDGAIPSGSIPAFAMYVGARNANGTPDSYQACKVQAVAIYSTTLSSGDISELNARMAAL